MEEKTLTEARKKAERAVADMADGDLKLKAFELILGRLLLASDGAPSQTGHEPKSKARRNVESRNESPAEGTVETVPVTAPSRILSLKREGFFKEERTITAIQEELQTRGWRYVTTALSGPLMKLVQARELRRAKVQDGNKTIYKYFNP
jgi:hypothetical protein